MQIKNDNVEEMINWLALFGKTEQEGVTRLLYTPAWIEAQYALKGQMEEIGLHAYFDCVGNLFGRLPGTVSNSGTILTGSHIDTVINGGKYDGSYGIIASFLAVKKLFQMYGFPKKSIEVVSLCEEEGSRFPITFWGSGNINAMYNLENIRHLTDINGVSFLQAMAEAGFQEKNYIPPVRRDIEKFIEIHIEQGIVLEKSNKSIGIVTHIVGQRRYSITITGESNHAGTTPMHLRKDCIAFASDFIHFTTKLTQKYDRNLVATIGKIIAKPNVPNVIAGEVELSLDIRHHQEDELDSFCQHIFSYLNEKTASSNFKLSIDQWLDIKPIAMSSELNNDLEDIIRNKNIPYQYMISGAGHDAQIFGSYCPTSLLFVPSNNGISHSPKEYTKTKDLEAGIDILIELLYKLAY